MTWNNHLLYSTDLTISKNDIRAKGGRVTHQLGPNLLVAILPDHADADQIEATAALPENDVKAKELADCWAAKLEPNEQTETENGENLSTCCEEDAATASGAVAASSSTNLSQSYLQGSVAIGVVMVGGQDQEVAYTDKERNEAQTAVMDALDYLQRQDLEANISFTIDFQTVELNKPNTIWTSAMATGANSTSACALSSWGDRLYMAWRESDTYKVFVASSIDGQNWEASVDTGVNAWKAPALAASDDLLYLATRTQDDKRIQLHSSADGVVWNAETNLDPAVTTQNFPAIAVLNGTLFLAYRNEDDNIIHLLRYENNVWSEESVTRFEADHAPALAAYDDRLYLAWKNADDRLKLSTYKPAGGGQAGNWSGVTDLSGDALNVALTAIEGGLAVYWRRLSDDELCFKTSNGSNWTSVTLVGRKIKHPPAGGALGVGSFVGYKDSGDGSELKIAWTEDIVAGSASETYEPLWLDPALDILGADSTDEYAENLRDQYKTDWAYGLFLPKYQYGNRAYTRGNKVKSVVGLEYLAQDNIVRVIAHESCHIFGAKDEYPGNGNCDTTGGVNDVPNKNYNCGDDPDCGSCVDERKPCLMDKDSDEICSWSRGQVGWNYWGDASVFASAQAIYGPALASLGDKVYMAWQDLDGWIRLISTQDKENWFDEPDPGSAINKSPGLTVYDGFLTLAWQAENTLNISRLVDGVWEAPQKLDAIRGWPAVAAVGTRLFAAFRHQETTEISIRFSDDGLNWEDTVQTGLHCESAPSLACFQGRLLMAWRDYDTNELMVASTLDGINFSNPIKTGDTLIKSPYLAVAGDYLHIAYNTNEDNGRAATTTSFDGESWTEPYQQYYKCSYGPAITADKDGKLVMVWKHRGDNSMRWVWRTDGPKAPASVAATEMEVAAST